MRHARAARVGVLTRRGDAQLALAAVRLIDKLARFGVPPLGPTPAAALAPYWAFVRDDVLLRVEARAFAVAGERWRLAAACVDMLHALLAALDVGALDAARDLPPDESLTPVRRAAALALVGAEPSLVSGTTGATPRVCARRT